jgi:hypothetical protein
MKRYLYSVAALFLVLLPVSANAADPSLTWERSQMQQVEVDQVLSETINSLTLLGEGEELSFVLAPNLSASGRNVYQVLIPTAFKLGDYAVRAQLKDGSTQDLAIIRVVEFQSEGYNPLEDTKTVTTLAVTFFAIVAMWGLADSPKRGREFEDDQTTLDTTDGGSIGRSADAPRQFHRGLISSIYLDQLRSSWTILSNRFSPIFSRFISDSGYLQFSLGALVLVLPIIGGLLGGLAFQDIQGNGGITTPSFAIAAAIIVLGTFDAGAGFVAAVVFGLCALTSHRFGNVYDVRTFLGLSILWFAPSFIANATRPLRRSRVDSDNWERLTDIAVGTFISGWAVKCLVVALDGYAHLKLPLGSRASDLGLIAGFCVALRYLIEGYVNHKNHYYLAFLSPRDLNVQSSNSRLVGWFVKSIFFLFFAVSFLGISWQLWAALSLLMIPSLLKVIKERFPNSPRLFQLLPVGIPAMVFMTFLGKLYSPYVHSLHLDPASASRTIFVLSPLPGFILGLIKLFGREPKSGDKRWYLRESASGIYRIGGVALFSLYIALTFGIVG